jgi:hypothetical protein
MPATKLSVTGRLYCNQMLDDRSSGDAIPAEFSKGLHPCGTGKGGMTPEAALIELLGRAGARPRVRLCVPGQWPGQIFKANIALLIAFMIWTTDPCDPKFPSCLRQRGRYLP